MFKPQKIDKCKLLVTNAKFSRTRSKAKARQKIPDAIRQMKTPFDKFKVWRQIYFRRVQSQTSPLSSLLSDKFKEMYQDKIIDKWFLTKQADFDKKIRQIPNSRFFKISLFKLPRPLFKYPSQIIVKVTVSLLFKLYLSYPSGL